MMKRKVKVTMVGRLVSAAAVAVFAGTLLGSAVARAQSITVGTVSGDPGAQVTFSVTLQTPGTPFDYVGVATRIAYDPVNTPIAATTENKPDCTVNSSIGKLGSFAFWPEGCTGEGCVQLRALIYYTHVDGTGATIPHGSQLFSCKVNISPGAPGGTYPLITSFSEGSTAASIAIDTAGNDGHISVSGAGCS